MIKTIKTVGKILLDVISTIALTTWVSAMLYRFHFGGTGGLDSTTVQYLDSVEGHHVHLASMLMVLGMPPAVISFPWLVYRLSEIGNNKLHLARILVMFGYGKKLEDAGQGELLEQVGYDRKNESMVAPWICAGVILLIMLVVRYMH